MTSNNLMAAALDILRMWRTPSLSFLPGPLRPGVVAPDRVQSMSQIELFGIKTVFKQMTCIILNW